MESKRIEGLVDGHRVRVQQGLGVLPALLVRDPEGYAIGDPELIGWLARNGFTQGDINDLGHDTAATDKLYECFLLNCGFAAGCWSAPRIPHPRHRRCR